MGDEAAGGRQGGQVLEVVDTNLDAYRLYERMGFLPVKAQQSPVIGPWMGFNSATVMVGGVG